MPSAIATKSYADIVKEPFKKGAIIRSDFPGFKEDYLAIHSIIRKYQPNRLLEIGTSTGNGTKVICRAMGINRLGLNPNKKVYSIDVPPNTDPSIIYPDKEDGHPERAGMYNNYPYTQLFGSSIEFDFSPYYPLDAWFIDGKHDYKYATGDTEQALKAKPQLIIWHDLQIDEVEKAVADTMKKHSEYKLYRVESTRIGYAVKQP